jgi:hypothetical protein
MFIRLRIQQYGHWFSVDNHRIPFESFRNEEFKDHWEDQGVGEGTK